MIPTNDAAIAHVVEDCRRLVRRQARLAAGVAALPVAGLDLITDVGVLMKVLPQINQRFGLTPSQIERLAPHRQVAVLQALTAVGSLIAGQLVTRGVVLKLLRAVGVRLSSAQAAKVLPVAGQVLSAGMTYLALVWVCEQHIRQCAAISRKLLSGPTMRERLAIGVARAQAEGSAA